MRSNILLVVGIFLTVVVSIEVSFAQSSQSKKTTKRASSKEGVPRKFGKWEVVTSSSKRERVVSGKPKRDSKWAVVITDSFKKPRTDGKHINGTSETASLQQGSKTRLVLASRSRISDNSLIRSSINSHAKRNPEASIPLESVKKDGLIEAEKRIEEVKSTTIENVVGSAVIAKNIEISQANRFEFGQGLLLNPAIQKNGNENGLVVSRINSSEMSISDSITLIPEEREIFASSIVERIPNIVSEYENEAMMLPIYSSPMSISDSITLIPGERVDLVSTILDRIPNIVLVEEVAEYREKPLETDQFVFPTTGDSSSSEISTEQDSFIKNKHVKNWERTWSLLTRFSGSFDTNLAHDPVRTSAFGFVPSITAGYMIRSPRHRIKFVYSFANPRYNVDTELTRFGNYFSASYRYDLGRWSFETNGEASIKGTNDDRETNNLYILTETIGYRFDNRTKLKLFGAYRLRRFAKEDQDRNAVNPRFGLKFTREINKKIRWKLGYRFEENRAISARQDYFRSKYKTGFELNIDRYNVLDAAFSYRTRRYKTRAAKGLEDLRRDRKWSFDVLWRRSISPRFGIESGYKYENQESNDFRKLYVNHQFVFSVYYHFGNGKAIEP